MRDIHKQETRVVSGAGLLTTTLNTAVASGSALGSGFMALGSGFMALGSSALTAGKIAATPLVNMGTAVAKILI